MPAASALDGSRTAVRSVAEYVTEAGTEVVPERSVTVLAVIVAASMASEKTASTFVLVATPVAPADGRTVVTVGAVVSVGGAGATVQENDALPERTGVPSEPEPLAGHVREQGLAFTLAAARGRAEWRPFARLRLTAPSRPLDPDLRFDAVEHAPPGLIADGPMARFRAPAYAAARAGRGDSPPAVRRRRSVGS